MAVYSINKVLSMPASPAPDAVYYVKGVADSRAKLYISDSTGTAYPVGILTEGDVISSLLSGYSVGSDIALSSSDTILQAFQKVQGQLNALSTSVSQGMKVPLPLDCSGNPDYPSADAGDSYKVTVAGRIGGASGPLVQAGDVITALTTNGGGTEAAVGSQWFILQANTDNATELVTGLTRIATSAEVSAGSEAFAYVSPLRLSEKLGDYVPEARTLTINGVTQDLSGDRTWNRLVSSDPNSGQASAAVFGGDLNSVKINTIYTAAASASNVPAPSTGIVFKGVSADTNNGFELYGARGGNLYTRGLDSGVYSAWEQVAYRSWVTANYQSAGNFFQNKYNTTDYVESQDNVDLNDMKTGAFWAASNVANRPNGNMPVTSYIYQTGGGINYGFQLGGRGGIYGLWFRGLDSDTFDAWERVASREWVTEQDYQAAGNYVTTDGSNGANITAFTGDLSTITKTSIFLAANSATNLPTNHNYVVMQSTDNGGTNGFRILGGSTSGDDNFYFQRMGASVWNTLFRVASREWVTANYQPILTNPITGTGVASRIPYFDSSSNLTSHASLTFDPSSGLRAGTNTNPVRIYSNNSTGLVEFSSTSQNIIRTLGEVNLRFEVNSLLKWEIGGATGILQAIGPQTIRTSSGNLTLATNSGDGNVEVTPNGAGQLEVFSNIRIYKDGVPEFRIGGNGNVAAPKVILAAAGSGGRTWTMQSGNSTNGVSSALSFSESTTPNLLVLNATAKVGINTDSPTDTLDINGSARIRTMSIAAGDYFVMSTGTGVLRRVTPAATLTLIGAQAARSITSPTGSISITGAAAGSTSTELEMQWGAAEW